MAKRVYLTTKRGFSWRVSKLAPEEGERAVEFISENGIAYDVTPSLVKVEGFRRSASIRK